MEIKIKNIDFKKLINQKRILICMIMAWGETDDPDQQGEAADVEELLNLIDEIQDYAVDVLGMKESEVRLTSSIFR